MIVRAQPAKPGLVLPQKLPDNVAEGESEAGPHSALEVSFHSPFPPHIPFRFFPPFCFLRPSNLLSKAGVGHSPVQWVVAECWGEI